MSTYGSLLDRALAHLIQPEMDAIFDVDSAEDEHPTPHPWTQDRHMLEAWRQEGEDGLRAYLEAEHIVAAEDLAAEWAWEAWEEDGPCCNSFSCPCGNGNTFRGL